MIFLDDHAPAHVHVLGDGEAKIEIGGDGGVPRMIYAERLSGAMQRRALAAVAENRTMLLMRWVEIHGRTD
ncbi:DUF4160 domain-containing protein [Sphingomonas sp. R86520]|uniref:DUF4160 domain-containing protein n=1 Tax=Sphingomonas sp. R86520 TaxID=3093859 RepID=UPI0036D2D628